MAIARYLVCLPSLLQDLERGVELEAKVHPKVRNHGEGPY